MINYRAATAEEAKKYGFSIEDDKFESGLVPQIFNGEFEEYYDYEKDADVEFKILFYPIDVTAICGKDFIYAEVITNPETADAQLMSWKKVFDSASEEKILSEFNSVIKRASTEGFDPEKQLLGMGFSVWQDNAKFEVSEVVSETEEVSDEGDDRPDEYTRDDYLRNPGKYTDY